MASRHRSRELAVQLCYQWELDPKALEDKHVLDRFWREQAKASDDTRPFFEFLVKGVAVHLPEIDARIQAAVKNWRMERVDKVDLAVMRVAVFEMLFHPGHNEGAKGKKASVSPDFDAADDAVIINEAIEIARRFGGKDSPSFVNGVLDALAKSSGQQA